MKSISITSQTVEDIISDGGVHCPLDLSVIPNHLGINLCAVDSVSWTKLPDDQLVSLTINFLPEFDESREQLT